MPYKSTRISLFLAICWLYLCIHLDRHILGVLAESIKSDLGLRDQQLGALSGTAFSVIYALMGLYFGGLADRADRLQLLRRGAWIWSLACIAAAFATAYPVLIAARGTVALGEAVGTASAVSLIAELAGEKHRARAASVFFTSAFLGAGTAAIAGGAVVNSWGYDWIAGWRPAMVAAGIPGLFGALYLRVFFRRESGRPTADRDAAHGTAPAALLLLASIATLVVQMYWPPTLGVPFSVFAATAMGLWWMRSLGRTDAAAYRATLGQRAFRYLVFAFAAVIFVDCAASFWFIPYAQRHFERSAAAAGSQLGGLMVLGGSLGCVLGGWFADRWSSRRASGRVWTAMIAVIGEGAAILAGLAQRDYANFALAFAAFCVFSGGWTGVAAAIGLDLLPSEHRGTGTAVYFLVTTVLGPGLGPYVVGWGSDILGSLGAALACACALIIVAAAALLRLGSTIAAGYSVR